jgi:arylsulfatase A-like enzyme
MMKIKAPKAKTVFSEGFRSAILGTLASFIYLAYYLAGHLVFKGSLPSWGAAGNNLGAAVRYFVGAGFLFPLVGFVFTFVAGALGSLVTQLIGLDAQRRRRTAAVITTGVVFAYLGIPVGSIELLVSPLSIAAYAVSLILGAGFVWLVWRRGRLTYLLARIGGFTLAGFAALWLVFSFLFPRFFEPPPPKSATGMNVVVVLSDAHRADVNSVYGGDVPTPNLERLAGMGVTYERCFAPSNWTVPSVVALFTGLVPEVSGMDAVRSMPPKLGYLPETLSEVGYRTWAVFANSTISTGFGMYRGFDYYANYGERFYGAGFLEYEWGPVILGWCFRLNWLLHNGLYYVQRRNCPEEGLEMLRSLNPAGGDFVYIHLLDAHDPYVPYDRFWEDTGYEGLFKRDSREGTLNKYSDGDITPAQTAQLKYLYSGEVRFVDEYVGRLLDTLEEEGLLDRTAVIFTADHGEEFNEHGYFLHGEVNLHHELTHVPLIVYWPGALEGGRRVPEPVSLCDIRPTILEALGLGGDEEAINGRSLLRPLPPDRLVFSQRVSEIQDNYRHSDLVVQLLPDGTEAALFRNLDSGEEELYLDYPRNPRDVLRENPDLAGKLEDMLEAWHARNLEMAELYGTRAGIGPADPAIMENLRGIGYLQ